LDRQRKFEYLEKRQMTRDILPRNVLGQFLEFIERGTWALVSIFFHDFQVTRFLRGGSAYLAEFRGIYLLFAVIIFT
jgi:hypothetical protein